MKKAYLDTNIYNRPYDDQTQVRIRLEAIATLEILNMIQSHALSLIWSFILDYENSLNPYEDVMMEIGMLSPFASEHIDASEEIRLTAKNFEQKGIKPRDALHIACALKGNADFFITCDDNIVKKCKNIDISINVINPIDFIRKVEVIKNGNTK